MTFLDLKGKGCPVSNWYNIFAAIQEQRKLQHDTLKELEPELKPGMAETVKSSIGSSRCKQCGKLFSGPGAKLLHCYLFHPSIVINQELYECGFCTSYKFSSSEDVLKHHLTHHQRSVRPDGSVKCLCGYQFREDGAFYLHLYYAHKATRVLERKKGIICWICDKQPQLNKVVDLVVHLCDRHNMFDHVRENWALWLQLQEEDLALSWPERREEKEKKCCNSSKFWKNWFSQQSCCLI